MSMMKTLARVAMGVAAAKGMSSIGRGARGRSRRGMLGRGGVGGALGTAAGAAALAAALGPMLSGRATGSRGLGGLLENLGAAGGRSTTTGAAPGRLGGGLDQIVGGLLGGAAGGAATGGLLGQIAGRAPRPSGQAQAPFGEVLDRALDPEQDEIPPTPEQEAAAGLLLRAMIQAARADGVIDDEERRILTENLEGLSEEERRFVAEEMERPADPEALARDTPVGLERQIYAASLLAIDVDTEAEADHLRRLAKALRLRPEEVARVHEEVGAEDLPGLSGA